MSLLQNALRDMATLQYSDHVSVRLGISSKDLEPESITERLQLSPDYVVRKGETVYKDKFRQVDSDVSIWSLSSEDKISSNCFLKHMDWMLKTIFGRTPAFHSLQNDGSHIALHVYINTGYPVVTPMLDVSTIQNLAQLKIPIDFIVDYQSQEKTEE